MKEAQIKVLELLEAHKISVESAAILLDAMYGKSHERQHSECKTTQHQDMASKSPNHSTENQPHSHQHERQSDSSMEDFMNQTLKQVTSTLKKATDKKNESSKKDREQNDSAMDTFSQIEKTFRDVTEKLNKYGK